MAKVTFFSREEVDLNFGAALKATRKAQGLSQGDLHRRSGIDRAYLSRIESGEIEDPRLSTVYRLALALQVSCNQLVEEALKMGQKDTN